MDYAQAMPHRRSRMGAITSLLQHAKEFAVKHWKAILVLLVLLFLFDWFQLRPMRVNAACVNVASANARVLLRQKAQVTTDKARQESYGRLVEQNMYLRTDYDSFYVKCMHSYGFGF